MIDIVVCYTYIYIYIYIYMPYLAVPKCRPSKNLSSSSSFFPCFGFSNFECVIRLKIILKSINYLFIWLGGLCSSNRMKL
jgi:hypothetical protein